jgi:hypothetical protein
MQPQASLLVTLGIPTLAVGVLLSVAFALTRVAEDKAWPRRFLIGAALWLTLSALLASSGLLARFDARPPPLLLIMLPTLLLPLALGFSSVGRRMAELPLSWLVGFHGFRFALELVMHEAAREGTMPEQMTFTGSNFDIVTGASALLVALLIAKGRATPALVLAWNALGSLLLAVIVVVAIASLPLFHAYGAQPAHLNTWVAYFPFVWLPAALVSAALFGHVVLWRRLLTMASLSSPTKTPKHDDQAVLERASHR